MPTTDNGKRYLVTKQAIGVCAAITPWNFPIAMINDGELWLSGVHIPEYTEGTWTNHTPRRDRKLLVHKNELNKLIGKLKDSGTTLVPLSLYFKDGKAKIEIAVARGKKAHDKREALKAREADREVARVVSRGSSGKSGRASKRYED